MSLKDEIKPYGDEITTGMPDSILSGLYRTVLNQLNIEESRFTNLVHKFTARTSGNLDSKALSGIRSNYRTGLLKSVMTWKVFMKGFQVINVTDISIGFQIWFNDDKVEPISVLAHIDLRLDRPEEADEYFETVLSKLLGEIMLAANVHTARFSELLTLYIRRTNLPVNIETVSSIKGKLKKDFSAKRISWKVFIKGLMFMDVCKFVFAVKLQHRRGDHTEHRRSIILDQHITEID